MRPLEAYLDLLGQKATDKITGVKGVITSISFDLFGCIQAIVKPAGLDKDGKMQDGYWLDVQRLDVEKGKPMMDRPDFQSVAQYAATPSTHQHGPENKPTK